MSAAPYGCGTTEYGFVAVQPTVETSVCAPDDQGSAQSPPANLRTGHAVEFLSIGLGATMAEQNDYRFLVLGAPGDLTSYTSHGGFSLVEADISDGSLLSSSTWNQDEYGTSGQYRLGYSLLATDVRDCYAASGSTPNTACGQELLVGAPGHGNGLSAGMVDWYEAVLTVNGAISYAGTIYPPAGTPNGAEFGASLSAWSEPPDSYYPWLVAPSSPDWVAVGAPGDEKVYLYQVTPSSSSPFSSTPVQVLSPPSLPGYYLPGKRFGEVVLAGDFDGDGVADLAVSAPEDNLLYGGTEHGLVIVYRGLGATGVNDSTSDIEILDSGFLAAGNIGGPTPDGFGLALAGGKIFDEDKDGLVIGAPTCDDDNGGLCVFEFELASPGSAATDINVLGTPQCWFDPYRDTYPSGQDHEFGAALAVGNFINSDGQGRPDTDEALLEELAVGAPGYDSEDGLVYVFLASYEGPDVESLVVDVFESSLPGLGARLGDSLASGHVQESRWEDLTIGAPERVGPHGSHQGMATITQARLIDPGSCSELPGLWHGTDDQTRDFQVMVFHDQDAGVHITWEDPMYLNFHDTSGVPCTFYNPDPDDGSAYACEEMNLEIAAGCHLWLEDPYPCGSYCTPYHWHQDGGEFTECMLSALGVWSEMGPNQQATAKSIKLDFFLELQPAGYPCNPGSDDIVELEVNVPSGVWTGMAAAELVIAAGDGHPAVSCFDQNCDIPHPVCEVVPDVDEACE